MLVTNPRRINHEQLRILARNAKGGITHIYLHWTAGTYEQVFDDYHINIGEQGELCNPCLQMQSCVWRISTHDATGGTDGDGCRYPVSRVGTGNQ